jgi:hypothetical protein
MWAGRKGVSDATVHEFNGSHETSLTMNEFVDEFVREEGVAKVNLWGIDEQALCAAARGFLAKGFKVRLVTNLCHHREVSVKTLAHEHFKRELDSHSLELLRWTPKVATTHAVATT